MPGGGKWTKQNKVRSGAYINFVSVKGASIPRKMTPGSAVRPSFGPSSPSDTTSVLGVAKLGQMIII